MENTRGFIFLMTLITITVISLLVLTSMQHILMYQKAMNALEIQHQNFYQQEAIATQLVEASSSDLDKYCIEYGDAPNQIMQRLKQNEGCHLSIDGLSYQYLVEELGDFPCLVAWDHGQKRSTHHRRVSVVLISKDEQSNSLIQLRNIFAINTLSCLDEEHEVKLGITSWRYFPSM